MTASISFLLFFLLRRGYFAATSSCLISEAREWTARGAMYHLGNPAKRSGLLGNTRAGKAQVEKLPGVNDRVGAFTLEVWQFSQYIIPGTPRS